MRGSSPVVARRDPTSRLKSVDLPTLGRPTMAIRGVCVKLEEDWVKVIHEHVGAGALTCPAGSKSQLMRQSCRVRLSSFARPGRRGRLPLHGLLCPNTALC